MARARSGLCNLRWQGAGRERMSDKDKPLHVWLCPFLSVHFYSSPFFHSLPRPKGVMYGDAASVVDIPP
jgi:hypothetical protein